MEWPRRSNKHTFKFLRVLIFPSARNFSRKRTKKQIPPNSPTLSICPSQTNSSTTYSTLNQDFWKNLISESPKKTPNQSNKSKSEKMASWHRWHHHQPWHLFLFNPWVSPTDSWHHSTTQGGIGTNSHRVLEAAAVQDCWRFCINRWPQLWQYGACV